VVVSPTHGSWPALAATFDHLGIKTGIDVGRFREAQQVEATGVCSQYAEHHEILPRTLIRTTNDRDMPASGRPTSGYAVIQAKTRGFARYCTT
jgi:hypothetical protein